RRDRDQLARARVVEPDRVLALLVQELLDAGERLESHPRPTEILGIAHVDMRDLVIRDGERPRGPGVEELPAERLLGGEEPRAAEGTVDVDRPADRPDPVLGDDEDVGPQPARVADERANEPVDGAEGG